MTRPSLKSSAVKDEFVCLTCPLSECKAGSALCPINARHDSPEPETYKAIMESFAERDRLALLKKNLEKEMHRVRIMKQETSDPQNKRKALDELKRLKRFLDDTIFKRSLLTSKRIAACYKVPLQIVMNLQRQRY